VAGAPKPGDKADWGPRIAQGKETMYKHAIEGFTGAKGMNDAVASAMVSTASAVRLLGEAEVDEGVIDDGLGIIRKLWDAGLAHRDIKPANLLVRDGRLLLIDVARIMAQVQRMMDQVARAVQFLFLFTLLAGLMVLYAAISGTLDERLYQATIMRTLGASRMQIARANLAEFASIGALAGLLAAATADAKSYEAALDAARALGLRPVEALCHLGRAILAESARDAVPAREHAARALEMLRAMDMRYWLPRAESLAVTAADRAQSGSRASRNP